MCSLMTSSCVTEHLTLGRNEQRSTEIMMCHEAHEQDEDETEFFLRFLLYSVVSGSESTFCASEQHRLFRRNHAEGF